MSLSTRVLPKRNEAGLIEATEYKHLRGKQLPDIEEIKEVEVTSKDGTRKASLYDVVGEGGFVIAFQPGASTKEEGETKMYSQKPGAMGCTGELLALDKAAPTLLEAGYKTLIASTKTSAQQRQVFKDKDSELPHKAVEFISDPEGKLAKVLGLFLNEDTLTNIKTKEKKEIIFIERVMIYGKQHTIENFLSPAAGITPAENVGNLLKLIQTKSSTSSPHSPRHFQTASGATTTSANTGGTPILQPHL